MFEIWMGILGVVFVVFSLWLQKGVKAVVAQKMGDNTPLLYLKNNITVFNFLGGVLVPLFSFFLTGYFGGWLNPLEINVRFFEKNRGHYFLFSLVGPLFHLLFGLLFVLFLLFYVKITSLSFDLALRDVGSLGLLGLFFYMFSFVNFSLFVFSFLPLPGLDGFGLLYCFSASIRNWLVKYSLLLGVFFVVVLFLLSFFLELNLIGAVSHGLFSIMYGVWGQLLF